MGTSGNIPTQRLRVVVPSNGLMSRGAVEVRPWCQASGNILYFFLLSNITLVRGCLADIGVAADRNCVLCIVPSALPTFTLRWRMTTSGKICFPSCQSSSQQCFRTEMS